MSLMQDIRNCLNVLKDGGLLLYPTDTVWGIGCDATNARAVDKIFALKQREESKSMIILLADIRQVGSYADAPGPLITGYLSKAAKPTTVIYENGRNVAPGLISTDGTVAIRVVQDEFCRELIGLLNKPLVSTSANISGTAAPPAFRDISEHIKKGVDYIAQHRQGDPEAARPSSIIRINGQKIIVLRE